MEMKTKIIKKKTKLNINLDDKTPKIEEKLKTSELHLIIHEVIRDVQQLPCSLKQICNLPQEKQQYIKSSHPSLASYYYLKPRQRAKLFHQINHKYRKDIKPICPPGSAPKKKTINFKKRFQIKAFDKTETSQTIKDKKTFTQKQQRNIHFT